MTVLQHDLRIAYYHNVRWYVVKNGFELLLLLADHLLVEEKVNLVFVDGVHVAFQQRRRYEKVEDLG